MIGQSSNREELAPRSSLVGPVRRRRRSWPKLLTALVILGLVIGGQVAAAPPPAPAPLGPANGASVTMPFTIAWSQVLDPAAINGGYNWQVSTASNFSLLVAHDSTSPSVTQATVSGLANGTYFWRVNAVNGTVETGPWSATRSFTVTGAGPAQLGAPTLNPPHGGTTQFHPWEAIRFSWSAVPGASTYTTEFSTDSRFPVSSPNYYSVTNIPGTSDGTLHDDSMPMGTWFMRVRALDADRVAGAASNVISFSVLYGNPVGPPPSLISPTGNPTLTLPVTFSWTDGYNPQSSGYEIQVSTSASFSTLVNPVPGLTNPSIVYTDLPTGQLFWRVRSHQGDSSPTTSAVTAWSPTGTLTVSSAPVALASINLTRDPLYSGAEQSGGVQLTARAPAGGAVVSYTSSNPTAFPVPATGTVDAGVATGAGFTSFAGQVTSPTPVTVTATYNGSSASRTVTVMPPTLKKDTLQSSVKATGGATMLGRVELAGGGFAPPGGVQVGLSSSSAAATVPATITIPAGAVSAGFSIPTSAVTASATVTISASLGGETAQWQITLTPSPTPDSLTLQPVSTTNGSQGIVTIPLSAVTGHDQLVRVTSSNPGVASVPEFATINASTDFGRFTIATSPVLVPTVVTISVSGGGVTRTADLTVSAILPALTALTVSPTSVAGGTNATGTVTLESAAPAGGVTIGLGSNLPGSASVPASVTVPAGATSATFPVTTFPVDTTTVQLSATLGATTRFASLGITRAAVLSAVSLSPTSVSGGSSSTGTVTLATAAPSGGTLVTLADDSTAAAAPASVTVPAGATSRTFTVTTSSVASSTPVVISGSSGGVTRSATLTVNPPTPVAPTLQSPAGSATVAQPVTLDWDDVPNAASYEVRVDDSASIASPFVANPTVTVSQAVLTGLPARQLWWRVRARNAAGVAGPFSSTRSFTTQAATATPSLSSLTVAPASVVGGAGATGTVTLTAAAPAGGAVVALTSANAAAASVPASVNVATGATSATFQITTAPVAAAAAVTLTAAWSGVSRTATLTVNTPASLASVGLLPTSVTGGASSQGTVTLTSAAPAGGLVVTLSSDSASATVPASVAVAAGATSAGFTATTTSVTAPTTVTVTALAAGVTRTATLTLNTAVPGTLPAPSLASPANDARFNPGQAITFDWSDVVGAASYTIQIDDQDTFSSPITAPTVTASTHSTNTLPTTRMWFRVRANNLAGAPGAWSASRRFEIRS